MTLLVNIVFTQAGLYIGLFSINIAPVLASFGTLLFVWGKIQKPFCQKDALVCCELRLGYFNEDWNIFQLKIAMCLRIERK